jgi:hypothetical protein
VTRSTDLAGLQFVDNSPQLCREGRPGRRDNRRRALGSEDWHGLTGSGAGAHALLTLMAPEFGNTQILTPRR